MGRDCQPRVGMTVKLTAQALERRAENGRADPSKGGTGVIVKCHPNWTCDVMWCVAAGRKAPAPPARRAACRECLRRRSKIPACDISARRCGAEQLRLPLP